MTHVLAATAVVDYKDGNLEKSYLVQPNLLEAIRLALGYTGKAELLAGVVQSLLVVNGTHLVADVDHARVQAAGMFGSDTAHEHLSGVVDADSLLVVLGRV